MKTMMQNKLKRFAALFLVVTMCLGIAAPYLAASEEDIIYIRTAEDLVELSKNCSYDKWSVGKKVILSNDISLAGVDFEPIPYFAGSFNGQGYTISDLELNGNYYPTGFFGVTKQGALIKNLNITGSIMPEGYKEAVGSIVGINGGLLQNVSFSGIVSGEVAVGGIVGINKDTGVIENAYVKGQIFGEHGTGGIAGRNLGEIFSSENEAYVNNSSGETTISLEDIDTNLLQNLYSVNSSDMMSAFTDTGGIAGYSSGMVIGCKNEGVIGYPHVGYNAGGIIGRNSGYVQDCTNDGKVLGRKDIGGIVGQVEPFLDVEVDVSDLSVIEGQLDVLQTQVNTVSNSAEGTVNGVNTHLDNISIYIDNAAAALEKLSNSEDSESISQDIENIEIPEWDENVELPEDVEIPKQDENVKLPENVEIPKQNENKELSEDVERPEWDSEISSTKSTLSELSNSLNGISNELRAVNEKVKNGTGEVSDGMEDINNQVDVISDSVSTMIDNVKNFTTDDVIADTSNVNISKVIYGKIADCLNKGSVQGDLNVGGIAGIMSIEYEVDPEDDTSMNISWEERKQYEVKAVLINCTNNGEITAKKDNVAGICGQVDIGVIANCFAYGSIASEGGNYVGGIAGVANTIISGCVANCNLSGNKYVGGIIGCGYTDEEEGGSTVSNSYSLVKITDCEQFEGAIAGCEEGAFENNYFVSDELQGINRVSYEKVAQPISYEELTQVPNIPEKLKGFTLSFVAEDKVIKTLDFNYGDSFGEEVFPEVPKKNGYDGQWDITDLTNLCFDTVVTAEYTPYVTVLESEETRENKRPVFLVEGHFSNEDTLSVSTLSMKEELQDELKMKGKVLEGWSISFSDDGQKRHSIRFLPTEDMKNAKLYVKENGQWTRLETTEIGSYYTFQVAGNEIELGIVSKSMEIAFLVVMVVILVLFIVMLILLEKKKNLFSSFIKKLFQTVGIKKLLVAGVVIGAAISVGLICYLAMLPQVRASAELAALSTDIIDAKNQSFNMELTADVGSNHIQLDSNVYVVNHENTSVFILEENGHPLYLVGDVAYLENGKAFYLGEAKASEKSLLEQIRELFKSTDIMRVAEQDKVIYSITTSGEEAKNVMAVLVPSTEGQIASAGETVIRIVATDGILKSVEVEGSATLKDSMETAIEVAATISNFSELEDGEYQIPEKVANAMKSVEKDSLPTMGEEMYRLMLAWVEFSGKEQKGTVALKVASGPINLQTEYDWSDISKGIDRSANASNIEKLPEMVYQICMDGEISCEKFGSSYIFQLKLDEEGMKNITETIAPETKTQNINLTNGVVEVVVENNEIASFEIVIDGTVIVLLSDVNASVEAEFIFE